MKQEKRITQNKLILLYLLQSINIRLSEIQIFRIVSEKNWINYFDLRECLFEMTQTSMVETHDTLNGKFYSISEVGRTTLSFFKKELLASLRKEIEDFCENNRVELKFETSLFADYIRVAEGEYRVTLKVLENENTIFEINMTVYSKPDAEKCIANWRSKATELYKHTFNLLNQS
jgi:mRNA-degrading endonuclease RelE of RelBE toxin-antitoxin system